MKTGFFARTFWFLAATLFLVGAAPGTVQAELPSPRQPLLVIQDSTAADRYQFFVPELLCTEGLNGFQVAPLSELTASFLSHYTAVVLPRLPLSSTQAALLQSYVESGGTLVGFRPDAQLAAVFGVSPLGSLLPEAWLQIHTGTPEGFGLTSQVLRYHGVADRYALNGARALATLYTTHTAATTSPAATVNSFGQGRAVLFSFDLTESIVLLRQGNPAWAGYPNTHDGFSTLRASQMFVDNPTNTFWNDPGDQSLNDVPQADEQLRLFSNALILATQAQQQPLPRLWYFPHQARSLLLLTGDQHGESESNSTAEIDAIQSHGGAFTNFLWYPFGSVAESTATSWLNAGHALGIHFDDTAEADNGAHDGSHATWAGMQAVLSSAMNAFAAAYPSAPAPITTRDHFLIWVSNNASGAPDPIAQAKLFGQAGIQLDTSFSTFPNRWGYMTGSGLPMPFLDITSGEVVPVYEQATQYEDDVQLSGAGYSTQWNFATAQSHYEQSLNESLTKYNTVVTMLFHPDAWSNYSAHATAVLQYAEAHGIPMPNAATWLTFWKARAGTEFADRTFVANTLSFRVTGAPAGLTVQVPFVSGTNTVSAVSVDGASRAFEVATYQGIRYASWVLPAGNHTLSVAYSPSASTGRIFGQISPASAAAATSVRVQGGTVDETVLPTADGSYAVGPLPAGAYTLTPSATGYVFNPVSRTLNLGAADVSEVNFTASITAGGDETLFTTQTPARTNLTDGPTAEYELGTVFTAAVSGSIKAITFWKASSETGTHVGHIWTLDGQLRASVTFTNESASGWQEQNLATPLAIEPNTPYIVSVNTGNTYYVATNGGLASQVVNQDLKSVVGNNGVFGSEGQFPSSSYQATNYFRDVVFTPGPPPPATGQTVFTTQTPALLNQSDGPGVNYELGTSFLSDTAGEIAAIRFWKAANESGVHTGRIWSTSGQALATIEFTQETASGWQQQNLSVPLTIAANTPYIVTVNTANSYYVATVQGLAAAVVNQDLRSVVGNNGVFGAVGQFPTNTYQATNYFRDVVFHPTPPVSSSQETLFTTQTPAMTNLSDGSAVNYELGTAFISGTPGSITALRFWKTSNESGTHIGRLWSSSGQILGSVTFNHETASGWQEEALTTPIPISPNVTYVVTVNTGNSFYVATNQGLAAPVINRDLHTTVGSNGLYGGLGQFPTESYQHTNYFRDVVFAPNP